MQRSECENMNGGRSSLGRLTMYGHERRRGICRFFLVLVYILLIPITCRAVEIYDSFPRTIHADERYVIYSHGLIVEGDNPRPISPKYGRYDFPGIKQAIFSAGGFNLIASQRPKNSDFDAYVGTLKSWVARLIGAGVAPSRITLTAFASRDLESAGINTALLAVCAQEREGRRYQATFPDRWTAVQSVGQRHAHHAPTRVNTAASAAVSMRSPALPAHRFGR
jgi:hypothetical protein